MQRAPDVASLGLLIAVAYVLARLTWLVVAPPTGVPSSPAPAASSTATTSAQANDTRELATRIAARHLFGRTSPATSSGQSINAPETNLNVTLRGIIAADDPNRSRALITAGSGNDSKSYRIGADIPGGANVHGIHPDRVILSRDGRLEALKLPRENTGSAQITRESRPTTRVEPRRSVSPPAQRDRGHPRSRQQHTDARLSQLVRVRPQMHDGKLVGYRLYPGSHPAPFLSSGLEPGDVVTAVNGKPVKNPADLLASLKTAKGDSSVRVTVKRGNQTEQVKISIPQ